jgi:methyl-accepting chemotaxis protein
MALRTKTSLVLAVVALIGVAFSFAISAVMPALPALALASLASAAVAGGLGFVFGSGIGTGLSDLRSVIVRFMKWDMDGEVPHTSRSDEIGGIAQALRSFQADAIKWSESHKSEQDSQVKAKLEAQQHTEELIHQFRGSIAGILGAFADSARQMDETARALCRRQRYQ